MDQSSIVLVVSCLGIAQALFLCTYLFTLKKGPRSAHLFLALIIFGLTLRIGKSILNEYVELSDWQRNLGIAGILLVGPSLWLYGKMILERTSLTFNFILSHYIPYVLFSAFCVAIPNRFDMLSLGIYYGVFFHLLVYLMLSVYLWTRAHANSRVSVLNWYRNLAIGIAIIWLFYIANVSGLIPFYIGGAICYSFLVYIFSFLLLRKHSFQLEAYQGQKLNKDVAEAIMTSLKQLFKDETIYLNHQVTLNNVAKSLKVPPKTLSRVINENAQMNFSEFVNSYRIEKAKKLLISSSSMKEKIASIAYDSGFNNVTSFNLAFKAMTKLTPSEFRKRFK